MTSMLFLNPWRALSSKSARFFEEELTREVAEGHQLYGKRCTAIAVTRESDDFLFQLENGTFAHVHLTCSGVRDRPPWPASDLYENVTDWMLEVMLRDHIYRFDLWLDW